jgi:ATP-dependent protease ClpP protease subunit
MQSWYKLAVDDVDGPHATLAIMDEIGRYGVTAKDFRADLNSLPESVTEITLDIHSGGGDVLDGFAIYNAILAHPATVTANLNFAASMASIIACAADTVNIAENGWFMIHNPWGGVVGESEDMRRMADVMDGMKAHAIKAYQRHVDADDATISAWMNSETWMTGEDFAGLGWDFSVSDPVTIAASIRPSYDVPEAAQAWMLAKPDAETIEDETPQAEAAEEPPAEEEQEAEAPRAKVDPQMLAVIAERDQARTDLQARDAELVEARATIATREAEAVTLANRAQSAEDRLADLLPRSQAPRKLEGGIVDFWDAVAKHEENGMATDAAMLKAQREYPEAHRHIITNNIKRG